MWGSVVFYGGIILAAVGLLLVLRPGAFRVRTRSQALLVVVTGLLLGGLGLSLPAPEHRVAIAKSHLDRLVPVWQFHETHSLKVAATPERVYLAIQRLRADEISLFRTLTWIRRGGRPSGPNILNPGSSAPLIEVATNSGFVRLVDSAPRELVIGTLVVKPPGDRRAATAEVFRERLPAGFALAAMNFLVVPDGKGNSVVETETRVSASDPTARRRFAVYWRIIYPGSAIIRRMWLRAVRRRATEPLTTGLGGDLAPGLLLEYASDGVAQPPWVVDSVADRLTLFPGADCARTHIRRRPEQTQAAESRVCVAGDTLFGWDAGRDRWIPRRPVGPGMTMVFPQANGDTVRYTTDSLAEEVISGRPLRTVHTVVLTVDGAGRPTRRLRERFASGLVTATGGVFERPDSGSAGGWRVEQAFELRAIHLRQ